MGERGELVFLKSPSGKICGVDLLKSQEGNASSRETVLPKIHASRDVLCNFVWSVFCVRWLLLQARWANL